MRGVREESRTSKYNGINSINGLKSCACPLFKPIHINQAKSVLLSKKIAKDGKERRCIPLSFLNELLKSFLF